MARQWIRACKLTIEGGGKTLDLSNMRVKFEVNQRTIQTPNNAIIRVYNLKESTALAIIKTMEGANVTLEAGYVENCGIIFKGQLKQAQKGRETPTETFVDLFCADGDTGYNKAVASKTLAAGSTLMDHVKVMQEAMQPFGIILGYVPTDLLQKVKYPRAVTFHGMAKDYLRTIAHTIGANWSIQEGELRIVPIGKTLGGVREMNSNTGMVGMPTQTADAILVRCLIDPQIKIHSQIHINEADINLAAWDLSYTGSVGNQNRPSIAADGIYDVLVITKIGDNGTGMQPWYMDLMCLAHGSSIPAGSSLINYPDAGPVNPQEGN